MLFCTLPEFLCTFVIYALFFAFFLRLPHNTYYVVLCSILIIVLFSSKKISDLKTSLLPGSQGDVPSCEAQENFPLAPVADLQALFGNTQIQYASLIVDVASDLIPSRWQMRVDRQVPLLYADTAEALYHTLPDSRHDCGMDPLHGRLTV